MPRKKKFRGAADFMAELARDPEYQAAVAETNRQMEAHLREFADEEALICGEAAAFGYRGSVLQEAL